MGQATRVANAAADAVQASKERKTQQKSALARTHLTRNGSSGEYDSVTDSAVVVTDINSPALLNDLTFSAVDGGVTTDVAEGLDALQSINSFLVGESMQKTQSFRLLSSSFGAESAPQRANPFARSNMQSTEAAMARSASQDKYPRSPAQQQK